MRRKHQHSTGGVSATLDDVGHASQLPETEQVALVRSTLTQMLGGKPADVSAPAPTRQRRHIPRTAEACERYLDQLARIIEEAGDEGPRYLPLVRRFERELAEVREEEAMLARLKLRLQPHKSAYGSAD